MQLRVLGPLEMTVDGETVPLGPPKQRAVLALLLLDAGRAVPVGRIIDALWPVTPPPSATKNVHLYISRIRKVLGGRLRSTAGGYRCDAGSDLDLTQFQELVERARRSCEPEAVALYRRALALWRGPALADLIAHDLLTLEAVHLEQLRLQTLDGCLELELGLGHHARLLPELGPLIATYPLHEPLRRHQIRAMYAAGHTAEARAASVAARELFQRELGVLPDLSLPARRPAAPVVRLPPEPPIFVGRAAELAAVVEAAGSRAAVVITGPAGAGKSALAARAAHRLAGGFGGALHTNLLGTTPHIERADPARVAAALLRQLGEERLPATDDEVTARWRTTAAQRRILVVLDNAADAAQVGPLLPEHPGCAIVTARPDLAEPLGAAAVRLGTMPDGDIEALLACLSGAERIAAEPAAARQVVGYCAGLPLAASIVGARLAAHPGWAMTAIADRLVDESSRLDELDSGRLGVRASLEVSRAGLRDPDAGPVLLALGTLDIPEVSSELIRYATGCDPAAALAELVAARLVETNGMDRYHLHDLVRLFARERAVDESVTRRVRARALEHLVATARRACQLLQPGDRSRVPAGADLSAATDLDGPEAAAAWCETERATLVAAVRRAATGPDTAAAAVALARALFWFFRIRSFPQDWLSACRAAVAGARLLRDEVAEAEALADLGAALERSYVLVEAAHAHRAALEIVQRLGRHDLQPRILMNLGIVHWRQRDFDTATDCFTASIALRDTSGDQIGGARARTNLGLVRLAFGRPAEAIELYQQALAVFAEYGDTDGITRCLGNLGEAAREQGRFDLALRHLRRALILARQLGDPQTEGLLLLDLAETYRRAGRLDLASRRCQRGLAVFRSAGHPPGEAEALHRLGMVRAGQARTAEAATHWRAAWPFSPTWPPRKPTTCANASAAMHPRRHVQGPAGLHRDRSGLQAESRRRMHRSDRSDHPRLHTVSPMLANSGERLFDAQHVRVCGVHPVGPPFPAVLALASSVGEH